MSKRICKILWIIYNKGWKMVSKSKSDKDDLESSFNYDVTQYSTPYNLSLWCQKNLTRCTHCCPPPLTHPAALLDGFVKALS